MRYIQTFVTTALFMGQAGCALAPHNCTLMYAPSLLTVELEPSPVLLGAWTVDLEMSFNEDYDLEDRDVQFLLERAELGSQAVITPFGDETFPQFTLDEDVMTGEVTGLQLWDTPPESVRVTLSEDDRVFADDAFTPEYDISEPNGEGCGLRYLGSVTLPTDL